MKIGLLLFLLIPAVVFAHPGGLDKQGGHFDRKANTYHCHKEPCFSIHKQAEEAFREAKPGTYSKVYKRKDWPHWIDEDRGFQNTCQEIMNPQKGNSFQNIVSFRLP